MTAPGSQIKITIERLTAERDQARAEAKALSARLAILVDFAEHVAGHDCYARFAATTGHRRSYTCDVCLAERALKDVNAE